MATTRRQLLRYLVYAVHACVIGGISLALSRLLRLGPGQPLTLQPRVNEQPEFCFRPPGAVSEPEFLSRCIHYVHPEQCTGCGLCEEVCIVAYRAIRVFPLGWKRRSEFADAAPEISS